ncbi:MAG: type II secretion system F family protein [Phycisphaerales bacterium]|nr:MAG: type II secretion system F family protein [Phycisphaerales bacterium]
MILTYEAVDAKGKRASDSVEASNPQDAIETLRGRGLFVTQISEAGKTETKSPLESPAVKGGRIPLRTLVLFTRQMAMLLRSGSGIVPSIKAISRQMVKPAHTVVLRQLVGDLEDGGTLTDALQKHPRVFDPVYYAIVAAGEASAALPEMFERLSGILGKRRAMRKKILGTLAYPALLVVMCTSIIMVLLFFVLPRFADMFRQLHVETPASTEMLLAAGVFVRTYWPVLVGLFGAIVAGVTFIPRTAGGKQWLSDVQTQIPVIGRLRSRLIQGQVLRTLGMLVESRVGVLEALDLTRRSTKNRRFQALFDDLQEAVTSGGEMSTALESSKLVEPYICQAVRTGEESGHLGEALTYCADVIDETNEELVNTVAKLIEPVILLGMGLVVGVVAISLFLPLFDLTSAIH